MSEERTRRPPDGPDAAGSGNAPGEPGGPDDILADFLRVARVVRLDRRRRPEGPDASGSGR